MLALKTFSKFDWMTFSGAESFEDGSDPMIGEIAVEIDGTPWVSTVIVDRQGLVIMTSDDDGEDILTVSFRGMFAARALASLSPSMSQTVLTALAGAEVSR